ncbi:hypothetical protein [Vannielia litorea]|uniref:hypothetical protein n=1 Tax=Vannielia litorea TaxID=1217970 RepID=UPI001BD0A135|nr:hypothetical protein [Vannielia litorea]
MTRCLLPTALLLATAACVQAEPDGPQGEVFATYGYDNGSLPPPYREEFRAAFSREGQVRLTACRGYGEEGCVSLDAATKPGAAERIAAAARASGLAQTPAEKDPEPPIGGGLKWGEVVLGGATYAAIALPVRADAARVDALLAALDAEVPEAARKAVNAEADKKAGK